MDLGTGSYNGLSFGTGTKFRISAVAGIDDLPPVRDSDADRQGDHGQFIGRALYGPRLIDLAVTMVGTSRADYNALLEQVRTAFVQPSDGVTELPLVVFTNRQINCRVIKRDIGFDASAMWQHGEARAQLKATDPRFYSASLYQATTGLPTASGGAVWPWTWPTSWGASSSGGTLECSNLGNVTTYPVMSITGPVDNPTVQNIQSGASLTFALTLASTDTLTIDTFARTVLLNGTGSRRSTMSTGSVWWGIDPDSSHGSTATTIQYRANTVQVGSQLTVSWRDAWV